MSMLRLAFFALFILAMSFLAATANETPLPEKAVGLCGIVLQPDGKPAANVSVAMATHGDGRPHIQNGRLHREQEPYTISTDKEGRFQFKYIDFEKEAEGRYIPQDKQRVDFILCFLHDSGFKRLTQQDWDALDENKTVTLEPWGRMEGTVKIGTQPGKKLPVNCQIWFDNELFNYGNKPHPHVSLVYDTITDESGKFSFERLPPSFVTAARIIIADDSGRSRFSRTHSHLSERFELKPGETVKVVLGGVGCPVVGKLVPAKEFETQPDWKWAHIRCIPALEKVESPSIDFEEIQKMVPKELLDEEDMEKQVELFNVWFETEDGQKFKVAAEEATKEMIAAQERNQVKVEENAMKQRTRGVAQDGTFRLDDVPEGDWQLLVHLDAPPPSERDRHGEQIGTLEYEKNRERLQKLKFFPEILILLGKNADNVNVHSSTISNCKTMGYFFDPIVVLYVLKNLEMSPDYSGTIDAAFKERHDISADTRASYIEFLEENELVDSDDDRYTITPKGRIALRQAEIIVLSIGID